MLCASLHGLSAQGAGAGLRPLLHLPGALSVLSRLLFLDVTNRLCGPLPKYGSLC